jgi:hypothetical protein
VKLALAALVGLALASAGCSVSHRSGDFACKLPSDCVDGRTCLDGFCVLPVDSGIPDMPHADAAVCPSVCTSCNPDQKTCIVDCALNGGCQQAIACPLGFSCDVRCSVADACSKGVNCTGSTSCKIACSGVQSCRGLTCGFGVCNVSCSGSGACSDVNCSTSCACDVTCNASALCRNLTCKPGCAVVRGCSSLLSSCNTCK